MTPIIAKTSITILALGAGCSAAAVKGDIYGERTWHKYVRSPNTSIVKPKGILAANITGNVCYLGNNDAPTILTCKPDDLDIPSIVVDFGQNVVGVVSIDFGQSTNSSQGLPGLKFAFRETQQFLTNTSDFTRSDNLPDGQKIITGSDQIAVANEPATWKNNASCQYGEQFECSHEDLTQWWLDGVYTTDMSSDTFFANETDPQDSATPTLEGKRVIFDGAKRNRDPYVGDLAIASLTSYLSHNAPELTRNIPVDLTNHQREDGWIPPASIKITKKVCIIRESNTGLVDGNDEFYH
ncbi:hypothetical protein N7508_001232 [Penicillium antarcticum]|uniref:uncharacterized protein n=1 Tax=Penicillium antarcticum TaxID=416450 RepID=UPI00238C9C10|nr:uncharacterized protein N7508_001232 [Penicillium antarcticum]KAJ5316724.1 hypothetical protein N7508_001232 [Penicillium antarcticum]